MGEPLNNVVVGCWDGSNDGTRMGCKDGCLDGSLDDSLVGCDDGCMRDGSAVFSVKNL